jgi:hypothetical protein
MKPEGRDHFGDLGIDWGIILKRIVKKLDVRVWCGFKRLRIHPVAGFVNAVDIEPWGF